MDPILIISKNPTLCQIADTAPPEWQRVPMQVPVEGQTVIALCEEKGFDFIPRKHCVAIFMDSVRQPAGKLQSLGVPVVTIDAPQPDCRFLWTPIDGKLFKPLPWHERHGIICPVRLSGYQGRLNLVHWLERMGVTVIERDDSKRSYQQYIDLLCSAKAVINLSADRKTDKPQLKGRVFETLAAGALLLEEQTPFTCRWLNDKEYCEWKNLDQLGELVESLLHRPTFQEKIAENGHKAFMENFDAPFFWREVRKLVQ